LAKSPPKRGTEFPAYKFRPNVTWKIYKQKKQKGEGGGRMRASGAGGT